MNDRECPGPTLERCARVLGVKVEQLRLVGEGANGLIVTDGSGVAYKFPKNRIALQSLKEEITYTKKLSHVLSVAVPEYLHQLEQLGEDEECCYLIAEDKQSGERIGTCSFLPKDGVYDLAYCVHKQFWGRGYATEMAKGMAEYARSSKAKAVTIWVTEGNNASVRVAQKLGCVQDGKSSYQKRGTDKTYTDYRYFLQF